MVLRATVLFMFIVLNSQVQAADATQPPAQLAYAEELPIRKQEAWPRISCEDKQSTQCENILQDALKLAKSSFDTDVFYIYAPQIIPPDFKSMLVIAMPEEDISGGDCIILKTDTFKKILKDETNSEAGSLYWQVASNNGTRLVLATEGYGWRGHQYALFSINKNATVDEFLKSDEHKDNSEGFKPIIQGWRPPLLFKDKNTLWAIDVGQPYDVLRDWRVYVVDDKSMRKCGSIRFYPQVKEFKELLPADVNKLVKLLDGAIGPGANEGTLQPTALLVKHTIANLARRPWALSIQPYNSRQEVDASLKKWSRQSRARTKIYNNILKQYPKAQASLQKYYVERLNMTPEQARTTAIKSLDILFRAYFVFSKSRS